MTTYTVDRSNFCTVAELASEIRLRVSDFYTVGVTDAEDQLLYTIEAAPGTDVGDTVYWLRDARGRTVGTLADVEALVRYANAITRSIALAGRGRTA